MDNLDASKPKSKTGIYIGILIIIIIIVIAVILTSTSSSSSTTPSNSTTPSSTPSTSNSTSNSTPATVNMNCVQSDWSKCDPSTSSQKRTVIINKSGSGAACGPSTQTCIPDIDCVMGPWDNCDPNSYTQNRTVTTPQSGNGAECDVSTQNCTPDINCAVGDWGPCDTNSSTQSRSITVDQSGSGDECPPLTQGCTPNNDCIMSTWGTCNPNTNTQTRTVVSGKTGNGAPCGALSKPCTPNTNCVQSGWSTCDYTGNQTRTVTTKQSGNGTQCGPATRSCAAPPYNWGSVISKGTIIYPNQYMRSSSGNRTLYLKPNGDLWLLHDMPSGTGDNISGNYYWTSRTNGNDGAYLVFQNDGNLVLYKKDGGVAWSSGSPGSGGDKLYMQDDGNLKMYTPSGGMAWQSDTARKTQGNFSTDVNAPTSLEYKGKCLDASIDSTSNPTGAGYSLNECNNSLDQRFYIDTYAGHAYMLKSSSGKCMDAGRDGGATWYWTTTCDPDNNNQNQFGKDSRGNMIGFKYQGSRCVDIGNNKLNWDCQATNDNQQVTWREF
jgi:hypothetical protein